MGLGQNIKALRKKEGLTQEQLAKKIGISTITIRQYENGLRTPKYSTVESIAKALDCSVSELINSKQEAEMIFEHVLNQVYGITPCETGIVDHGSDFMDASYERENPGIIINNYMDFILNHSFILEVLNKLGVTLKILNWHHVLIRHENQEKTVRISELQSFLEHWNFQCEQRMKKIFEYEYGFRFESNELTEEDDTNAPQDNP